VAAATRYLVSRQMGGAVESAGLGERQQETGSGGFQGRPGKDEDVCYSFWCGGALRVRRFVSKHRFARFLTMLSYKQVLLGSPSFDTEANTRALLDSQSPIGGFGKAKGEFPGEL
jgi:geranylgeranyl transferase type-1 subunit beta